jgi:hypothetical protein
MRLALLSYALYGVALAQRREAKVVSIDRKNVTTEQLCSTRLVSTFVLDIETTKKTKHVNSTAYREHCDFTTSYFLPKVTVVLTDTGTTTEETTVSGTTRIITPTGKKVIWFLDSIPTDLLFYSDYHQHDVQVSIGTLYAVRHQEYHHYYYRDNSRPCSSDTSGFSFIM